MEDGRVNSINTLKNGVQELKEEKRGRRRERREEKVRWNWMGVLCCVALLTLVTHFKTTGRFFLA